MSGRHEYCVDRHCDPRRAPRLCRTRFSSRDQRTEAFDIELLNVVEIDADDRISACVMFDPDDIDAAFEELDARYLAGEATAHAQSWRFITSAIANLNRHETPSTTTDYVIVDHQLHNEVSGITGYLHASWDLTPDLRMYIETVHRLSDVGGVITLVVNGTSREGLDAEWRIAEILTREGDDGKRCEVFDETDLDAALARFDELSKPRLENAASQAYERLRARFEIRDWAAIAEMLADLHYSDDRRRVINAGTFRGRDAEIASMRASADLGVTSLTSVVIATRGDRLALCRTRGATSGAESFDTELLRIVEIDAAGRLVARVVFDLDDIEAALEELDTRYLAGEAAPTHDVVGHREGLSPHSTRHELRQATPNWVNVDHRRAIAFAPGESDCIRPRRMGPDAPTVTSTSRPCIG